MHIVLLLDYRVTSLHSTLLFGRAKVVQHCFIVFYTITDFWFRLPPRIFHCTQSRATTHVRYVSLAGRCLLDHKCEFCVAIVDSNTTSADVNDGDIETLLLVAATSGVTTATTCITSFTTASVTESMKVSWKLLVLRDTYYLSLNALAPASKFVQEPKRPVWYGLPPASMKERMELRSFVTVQRSSWWRHMMAQNWSRQRCRDG